MNTQQDLVDALRMKPLLTENELMRWAFGYERNARYAGSNKKYADLLRRALDKGRIKRIKLRIPGSRAVYKYYVPYE